MNIKQYFSENEIKLFTALGYRDLLDIYFRNAYGLYHEVWHYMTLDCKTGPAIDALKRGLYAINHCTSLRMTEEFDDIISF